MLLPSYWVLGRLPGNESKDHLAEWNEIKRSGALRATGVNLDWLQRLSPLRNCIFLWYGQPYTVLSRDPSIPALEFDTNWLLSNGGLVSGSLDGELWDHYVDAATSICDETEKEQYYDSAEMMEMFSNEGRITLPPDQAILFEKFSEKFRAAADKIHRQALTGTEALRFLESTSIGVEVYFPGELPIANGREVR